MTVRTPGEGGTLSHRPPSPSSPVTDKLDFKPAVVSPPASTEEEEGSLRTGVEEEVGAPPLPTPLDGWM